MEYERSRSPTMRSKANNPNTSDGSAKVYVCFLPSEVQQPQLKETFEECGTVKSIYIKRKDDGFTFAYIEYEDAANAQKAIQTLNRRKIGEKSIMVKPGNKNPAGNANGGQKPTFRENNGERNFDKNRNNDRDADRKQGGGFRQDRNGGNGERKPMVCFKCQGEGHMARNCTQQGGGDRPPRDNNRPPRDSNRPPRQNGERPPRDNNRPPRDNYDRPARENNDRPPRDNNDRPPRENNDRRPSQVPKVEKPAQDIDY